MQLFQQSKKIVIVLYDLICLVAISVLLNGGFASTAYAYVDPSVMTYTIQALAGVAVALSAVAGVAFRRSRRALFKLLKVDENANKEIEPEVHRIEASRENLSLKSVEMLNDKQQVLRDGGVRTGASAKRDASNLNWPKKFASALLVAVFCSFTLFITAPFEIVAGASSDLSFSLDDVWWIMALFAAACALVGAIVLSFVPKKAFTTVLVIAFCFGLACYVQAAAMNGGLPQADGRAVDWWGRHSQMMVISAVVWALILIVPAIIASFHKRVSRFTVCILSVALVLVQGVGVASLFVGNNEALAAEVDEGPIVTTEDGLFEVSSKNNVIVFVLDCYDTKVFQKALEDDPSMLDEYDGFVWYKNSAGEMIPTSLAIPYLLTGETPSPDETAGEYLARRYPDSSFLEDLSATNYSVGIYTDSFGVAWMDESQAQKEVFDNVTNIHPQKAAYRISEKETIVMLAKCAFYRDMLWLLKPRFWFYTDEMNQRISERIQGATPEGMIYYTDDVAYHKQLRAFGLTVADGDYDGAFRFIHLNGAHYPYNIDENGNDVGLDNSDQERQARGITRIVGEYLQNMKSLGVYEDATIIITSDHGDWYASMEMPTESTEPILLVKPSGSGSEEGIRVSDAPVSHADFHASVLKAMGASADVYTKYGYTYDEIGEDMQRTRTFYHIFHDLQEAKIRGWLKYEITGDVTDFSNWTFTGDMWETDYTNVLT